MLVDNIDLFTTSFENYADVSINKIRNSNFRRNKVVPT